MKNFHSADRRCGWPTQAQFDADQLLTQREKVSKQIREALEERASEFHVTLDGTAHGLLLQLG